jgi:O-antigen/teichoic acid export membrane protein
MNSVSQVSGYNIASRVAVAAASIGIRHLFTILSGIVVARELGPTEFGYFMFLLSGFMTLHTFLDLYTSQAFFTSICKQVWPPRLYLFYSGWVGLQLLLPALVIGLVLPSFAVSDIWRGQARELVLLALTASFSQRVLWQVVVQIYESHRLTARVQLTTAGIMTAHLAVVIALQKLGIMSAATLFIAIAAEFAVTGAVMLLLVPRSASIEAAVPSARQIAHEFLAYIYPLLLPLLLATVNSLSETWLLQIFGGPKQQAFFSVAQQYANIGLMVGYPAVNIFWKEIAAAHTRNDAESLRKIYINGTRVLFVATSVIAGFCMFWSGPIIHLLLGPDYDPAAPVFAITLLNSIFQCMGLIVGIAYMATGRTRAYSILTLLSVFVSVPGTVLLLWAFKLGAFGLALKLAVLSIIFQLGGDWYNCRTFGWKTDNKFRMVALAGLITFGAISAYSTHVLMSTASVLLQIAAGAIVYGILVLAATLLALRQLGYDGHIVELKNRLSMSLRGHNNG